MEFQEFNNLLKAHFEKMIAGKTLLEVDLDKDTLWNLYLDSFPAGTNEIYNTRREFDCNCCKAFIRKVGNVVVINEDLTITTLWDFNSGDLTYQPVVDALSAFVRKHPITDKFLIGRNMLSNFKDIVGIVASRVQNDDKSITTFNHFNLSLPNQYIMDGEMIGTAKGQFRDTRNVFKRSLDELTKESVDVVLELISQGSLYKGDEWKAVLTQFKNYQHIYSNLPENKKELYCWATAPTVGAVIGRIRNHSIGTLLIDISENVDLDEAVRKYEVIVAPQNYKRPKAIFTKAMLEQARKTVEDLGYTASLGRRFARLDDITVNNILFANRDTAKKMTGFSVFDEMAGTVSRVDPKKFTKVEEINIESFINDVLPKAKDLEILVTNDHSTNFVSLIAPQDRTAPTMFKWNNNFGWAYNGNVTDSLLKENVKSAGGKVDGVLRFSIQWNDRKPSLHDLDAHCIEPDNNHIYFGNCRMPSCSRLGGTLDVDIISPTPNKSAVENITWSSLSKMRDGTYRFYVNRYSGTNTDGFRAEIEFNGTIYAFDYSTPVTRDVEVAVVTLKDGQFTIQEKLPSSMSSKDIWSLNTNTFVPVSVLMYSPNYWDEQNGIGNKHYFFMLKNCVNPDCPNGFYNEFLNNRLIEHKRVFEALGSKMAVEPDQSQLSGIGFSSTKRAELIVKVKGSSERTIKIKI